MRVSFLIVAFESLANDTSLGWAPIFTVTYKQCFVVIVHMSRMSLVYTCHSLNKFSWQGMYSMYKKDDVPGILTYTESYN